MLSRRLPCTLDSSGRGAIGQARPIFVVKLSVAALLGYDHCPRAMGEKRQRFVVHGGDGEEAAAFCTSGFCVPRL